MEETPPSVKKLLEAWLIDTLTRILHKLAQDTVVENASTCYTASDSEKHDPLPPPMTSIAHIVNSGGDDTFATTLKEMEAMNNENKTLQDRKRDGGWFFEQPYSDDLAPHAIPKTFNVSPYLKIYDEMTDPRRPCNSLRNKYPLFY